MKRRPSAGSQVRHPVKVLVPLITIGLLLSACGGDDEKDDGDQLPQRVSEVATAAPSDQPELLDELADALSDAGADGALTEAERGRLGGVLVGQLPDLLTALAADDDDALLLLAEVGRSEPSREAVRLAAFEHVSTAPLDQEPHLAAARVLATLAVGALRQVYVETTDDQAGDREAALDAAASQAELDSLAVRKRLVQHTDDSLSGAGASAAGEAFDSTFRETWVRATAELDGEFGVQLPALP